MPNGTVSSTNRTVTHRLSRNSAVAEHVLDLVEPDVLAARVPERDRLPVERELEVLDERVVDEHAEDDERRREHDQRDAAPLRSAGGARCAFPADITASSAPHRRLVGRSPSPFGALPSRSRTGAAPGPRRGGRFALRPVRHVGRKTDQHLLVGQAADDVLFVAERLDDGHHRGPYGVPRRRCSGRTPSTTCGGQSRRPRPRSRDLELAPALAGPGRTLSR